MPETNKIKILFIAGFGPIAHELASSARLYRERMRIPFSEEEGGYLHTADLPGARHFALWPLSQAAQSCFSQDTWPSDVPVPHAWLEFDVESVESATAELESNGYRMLVRNKQEPWGQKVSRFIDPDGILVGLTFTPSMRDLKSTSTSQ
jgi:hypothetical protein